MLKEEFNHVWHEKDRTDNSAGREVLEQMQNYITNVVEQFGMLNREIADSNEKMSSVTGVVSDINEKVEAINLVMKMLIKD